MAIAAKKNTSSEIESLVATLAGRQHDSPKPTKQLTGPERAAVLMLALGEQHQDAEPRGLAGTPQHIQGLRSGQGVRGFVPDIRI